MHAAIRAGQEALCGTAGSAGAADRGNWAAQARGAELSALDEFSAGVWRGKNRKV